MRQRANLLLVNQYFWPDWAATAQLLADLAESAASSGLQVTVLTGRGSYASRGRERLAARETWRGVQIRRLWCTNFGRRTAVGRVADYASFLVVAAAWMLGARRYEVVVCLSTPPLVAFLGLLARRRGAKFIYKVEDLYPDVAIALGTLAESAWSSRILQRLSGRLLRDADCCVALDETMRASLTERGARRVVVIPNWADGGAISPDAEAGAIFRRENDLDPGRLVILYSGNLGRAHRFDAVVQAAQRLAGETADVLWLFVGGGPRLGEVRQALHGSSAARFLPYLPREQLHDLYNAADLHLITLRDEVAGMLVPSKYAAALAAGKPVLLAGGAGTEMFAEVREDRLGWACGHRMEELVAAVEEALRDPQGLTAMGSRARRTFDLRYSRKQSMSRWLSLLEGFSLSQDSDTAVQTGSTG
jgi:glycosyltransferase involved in cell wall biosynthesis